MPKKIREKNNKGKNTKTTKISKPIEEKETIVVKEKKGKFKDSMSKMLGNTPFVIAICIILLLVGTLLFTLSVRKVPKTANGDEIIATVKGKKITAEDLYQSLKETYGTDALINLIDTYIADKEVDITDADMEYVDEVIDYYKEYAEYYGTDLATFLANYVGLNGIKTEDEFRDFVLEDYKKTLAVKQLIAGDATEDELKEYYKENYSDKLTAKHILIEIDSEAEDKEKAEQEAYDKAVSLIKQLKKVNKDNLEKEFEKLAEKNSDDSATYDKGGLIENFTKKDVVGEFFEAANELKDGEFTLEPVKSSYGYHIILKISSTPVEKFKDIKEEVKKAYAENLLTSDTTLQVTKWDELRKQYKLSIEDDFIKDVYKNTVKDALKTDSNNIEK